MSAGLISGEISLVGFKTAIFSLCPYMAYVTLLFIYFVPGTMAFCSSNESSPYLFQSFCTCCCLSRKLLHGLIAWLALCHHPPLSLNGTCLERTFSPSVTTLSQPPRHSTVLPSWGSTSPLNASLLSLKCKVKKAANFRGLFTRIPDSGIELIHNKGFYFWKGGRKRGRGNEREKKEARRMHGRKGSNANK